MSEHGWKYNVALGAMAGSIFLNYAHEIIHPEYPKQVHVPEPIHSPNVPGYAPYAATANANLYTALSGIYLPTGFRVR